MRYKRYRLVVFDWDGTLMDSTGVIASCIQRAAGDLGYPVPDATTASHVIGLGLRDALALAVPQLPRSEYQRMAERYRFHFLAEDSVTLLFEGALALLNTLTERGHSLAVATGKSSAGLARALRETGTESLFSATRCADQTAPKPAPDMLHELMEELGATRESTIMIGDTTHDLQMAANAGVSSVAITHGAHPRLELAARSPLACVDSLAELSEWLQGNA